MIKGSNDTTTVIRAEAVNYFHDNGTVSTTDDVLSILIRRRNNAISGGTNCIPLPFQRFRSDIPGIEQGQFVVVTASAKTCKTQLTSFVYIYHVLDYAFENPDKCSVHIIYFPLEESVEKIVERYMSHLLFKLDGIRISPSDLRSTSVGNPVPQDVIELLQSDKYQKRLAFFNKCVQFELEDTNPTGIMRVCEDYAKKVGTYKSHTIKSRGLSGDTIEVFDSYVQNDPNHYKIVVVDHIGLVDKEQGFRTKDSVDKLSEYYTKYLRNRYNYTCIAVQQQASDSEGLEAVKQKRTAPTMASLGDSKYTGRDADLVLGLYDPSKFGKTEYMNYIISDMEGGGLRNYARFMSVLANRNGEMGGICPLFFDGMTCTFMELPLPNEPDKLNRFYDMAKDYQNRRRNRKMTLMIWVKHL